MVSILERPPVRKEGHIHSIHSSKSDILHHIFYIYLGTGGWSDRYVVDTTNTTGYSWISLYAAGRTRVYPDELVAQEDH